MKKTRLYISYKSYSATKQTIDTCSKEEWIETGKGSIVSWEAASSLPYKILNLKISLVN